VTVRDRFNATPQIGQPGGSSLSFIVGVVALLGLWIVGGAFSLLPVSGLRCPEPAARVVLDPGHGGDDPGAINDAAGLIERELALDIARRAESLLGERGYSVALTRRDAATGYANTPRGAIANACHAFAYVSVHLNSFGEPEPNYAKTFWGVEGKDAAFAAVMQAALVGHLRPGTALGDSGLEQLENGGLLTARMPAILVEPVFLSNPAEAARLQDARGERRHAVALAIADGVDVWLRSRGLGPSGALAAPGEDRVAMTGSDRLRAPARGSVASVLSHTTAMGSVRQAELWEYVTEVYRMAPLVGLDPAIVVAQSALETGWWQSPAWVEHLNPAGIGITGPDVPSATWASGTEAARAHLVHLYLYAVGPIPPGHPLAPYVPLDPRYDAALAAGRSGSAATIADLAGRWAADPDYATKIAAVGNRMWGSPALPRR
jgi:N-acetylmuramoyl-L-alanine amidase